MQYSCKYAHILTVLLKAKKYILHQFLLILSMQTYELASIFGSAVIASHKKKKTSVTVHDQAVMSMSKCFPCICGNATPFHRY